MYHDNRYISPKIRQVKMADNICLSSLPEFVPQAKLLGIMSPNCLLQARVEGERHHSIINHEKKHSFVLNTEAPKVILVIKF